MVLRVIGIMLAVLVLSLIGGGLATLVGAPQWAGVLAAFTAFGVGAKLLTR